MIAQIVLEIFKLKVPTCLGLNTSSIYPLARVGAFLSDTEKMLKKAMEAREKKRQRSLGGGPFPSQHQQGSLIESAVLRPPPKSAACVVDLGPANKYNKHPLLDLAPRNKPWQRRKSFN